MSTAPEPLDPSFQIALPAFEGPLDLLLHLIRKHELDVLDLPIAFVTERYLGYVTMMEQLNLDIASEYLVMAATLAHIKSKMLLPQEPEDQKDDDVLEEEVDPRAELIRRLLEYQKYKAAAEQLGARGIAGRDVFVRGSDAPEASGPPPLVAPGLFKLLDAFQAVLKRAQGDAAFEITAEGISIQDRMRQLVELLRERRQVVFEDLFEGQVTIYDLVVTFMAILEMGKRRLVRIYQADPHSPIHLRSTVVSEDEEALSFDEEWRPDLKSTASPEDALAPDTVEENVSLAEEPAEDEELDWAELEATLGELDLGDEDALEPTALDEEPDLMSLELPEPAWDVAAPWDTDVGSPQVEWVGERSEPSAQAEPLAESVAEAEPFTDAEPVPGEPISEAELIEDALPELEPTLESDPLPGASPAPDPPSEEFDLDDGSGMHTGSDGEDSPR